MFLVQRVQLTINCPSIITFCHERPFKHIFPSISISSVPNDPQYQYHITFRTQTSGTRPMVPAHSAIRKPIDVAGNYFPVHLMVDVFFVQQNFSGFIAHICRYTTNTYLKKKHQIVQSDSIDSIRSDHFVRANFISMQSISP